MFFGKKEIPIYFRKKEAIKIVKKSLNFRVLFNFNAQFLVIHRSLVETLTKVGPLYQSPYPDYYSTTALLLKANRILAIPEPLVVVGITPKSFGFYYSNKKENEGLEFLKQVSDQRTTAAVAKYVMPGPNMNTSWLLALQTVKQNFGQEFKLRVNYNRYRFLQLLHPFKKYAAQDVHTRDEIKLFSQHLNVWEKCLYLPPLYLFAFWMRNHYRRKVLVHNYTIGISHPQFTMKLLKGKDFSNILEVVNNFSIRT